MSWVLWVLVAIVLVIFETITVDFFFLMLSVGAFAAAIAAVFSGSFTIQIIVFSIVAVASLLFVRPWARKHLNTGAQQKSNVYALQGQQAVTLTDVSTKAGRVKIGGEVWSARFDGDGVLPAGVTVIVEQIVGANAYVREANRQESRK